MEYVSEKMPAASQGKSVLSVSGRSLRSVTSAVFPWAAWKMWSIDHRIESLEWEDEAVTMQLEIP